MIIARSLPQGFNNAGTFTLAPLLLAVGKNFRDVDVESEFGIYTNSIVSYLKDAY